MNMRCIIIIYITIDNFDNNYDAIEFCDVLYIIGPYE